MLSGVIVLIKNQTCLKRHHWIYLVWIDPLGSLSEVFGMCRSTRRSRIARDHAHVTWARQPEHEIEFEQRTAHFAEPCVSQWTLLSAVYPVPILWHCPWLPASYHICVPIFNRAPKHYTHTHGYSVTRVAPYKCKFWLCSHFCFIFKGDWKGAPVFTDLKDQLASQRLIDYIWSLSENDFIFLFFFQHPLPRVHH